MYPQKEWLSWQLPNKNRIMVFRVFRFTVIIPTLWAEKGRKIEVTRKEKSDPKAHRVAKAKEGEELGAAVGISLLVEKNRNQLSDKWYKPQQQAKTDGKI